MPCYSTVETSLVNIEFWIFFYFGKHAYFFLKLKISLNLYHNFNKTTYYYISSPRKEWPYHMVNLEREIQAIRQKVQCKRPSNSPSPECRALWRSWCLQNIKKFTFIHFYFVFQRQGLTAQLRGLNPRHGLPALKFIVLPLHPACCT